MLPNDKRISRRLFDCLTQNHRKNIRNLVGRLLTLVDGMTEDVVKRKALKNMVEDLVYGHSARIDESIRYYSECLALALKEKCDWVEVKYEGKAYNPLIN